MKYLPIFLFVFFCSYSYSQKSFSKKQLKAISDSILLEGNLLYQLERSAWYSGDLFATIKFVKPEISGYVSLEKNGFYNTLFYKIVSDSIFVIADYCFQADENSPKSINTIKRNATDEEIKIIRAKLSMLEYLISGKSEVRQPKETSLNLVVVPLNRKFKVYIITGLTGNNEEKLVPLGNDYLGIIDENYTVIEFSKIHMSFIPTMTQGPNGEELRESIHSHVKDRPFISSTDICTLLLYGKLYGMTKHSVFSTYPATFDIKKNKLKIKKGD